MRSFHFITIACALAFGAGVCCMHNQTRPQIVSHPPFATELAVTSTVQTYSYWCWAAGIAMAEEAIGFRIRQCEVANMLAGPAYHCCDPKAVTTTSSICNQPASSEDMKNVFRQLRTDAGQVGVVPEDTLQQELAQGHPVLLSYGYPGGMCEESQKVEITRKGKKERLCLGHIVFLHGFSPPDHAAGRNDALYHVTDPGTGEISQITYAQMLLGQKGKTARPLQETWIFIGRR